MPEGDTIHKVAAELERRLGERTLTGGRIVGAPTLELAEHRVRDVQARGKHLFLTLAAADGRELIVRSHLGMYGSWHAYRDGERWKKPARRGSIVLRTTDEVFVCFDAKEIELLERRGQRAFDLRRNLGPDVVRRAPTASELERRVRAFVAPEAPVVDLLLDQRVACGVGNVYKSEVLFLEQLHPLRQVAGLKPAALLALFTRAHELLAANLTGAGRVTRSVADGRGSLWVYGRTGRGCFRCATPIESARLGRHRRSTYWCPRCQA